MDGNVVMKNAYVVYPNNLEEAVAEIQKTGAYKDGIELMKWKALHFLVKIEDVSPVAANIIKQEMLSKGGEASIHKDACLHKINSSNVLLMGTLSQYQKLLSKLQLQPYFLNEETQALESVIGQLCESKPQVFRAGKYTLPLYKKTHIIGILNITPDSFFDGGIYMDLEAALKRAKEMVKQGADIIEVGGQSYAPGYSEINTEEELDRVIPILKALVTEIDVPISVDTAKLTVVEESLKHGCCIVNDIWGLQKYPEIANLVANYNAGLVIMHNKADNHYNDIIGDIIASLRKSIDTAMKAGIMKESIIIDPGIGATFGKDVDQQFEILKHYREFSVLGCPVMLAISRKSFLKNHLGAASCEEILPATIASTAYGISQGANIIRAHDIDETNQTIKVIDRMLKSNVEY